MAIPLRGDQPEFKDEEITTADLARGKRSASETTGPRAVTSPTAPIATPPSPTASETPSSGVPRTEQATPASLFPGAELDGLRARWKGIQSAFVDEPRQAVEQADGLVASAMKRLAEVFSEERARLENQWDRGDNVSTEDLRVALQRYRAFFDRLLSV
jgi:hypothetical protein